MNPTEAHPDLGIATWAVREGLWVSVNLDQEPSIGIVADNSIIHLTVVDCCNLEVALAHAREWVLDHTRASAHRPGPDEHPNPGPLQFDPPRYDRSGHADGQPAIEDGA